MDGSSRAFSGSLLLLLFTVGQIRQTASMSDLCHMRARASRRCCALSSLFERSDASVPIQPADRTEDTGHGPFPQLTFTSAGIDLAQDGRQHWPASPPATPRAAARGRYPHRTASVSSAGIGRRFSWTPSVGLELCRDDPADQVGPWPTLEKGGLDDDHPTNQFGAGAARSSAMTPPKLQPTTRLGPSVNDSRTSRVLRVAPEVRQRRVRRATERAPVIGHHPVI